jgi:hypothetical protein
MHIQVMCVCICFCLSSATVDSNDIYYADWLQHQMPVFYIYCKHLYVIKFTAYHDNAVAEVTSIRSTPTVQVYHYIDYTTRRSTPTRRPTRAA